MSGYGARLTQLITLKRTLGFSPIPAIAGALTAFAALAITDHIGMPWFIQLPLVMALGTSVGLLITASRGNAAC
ncbi:hypothetical protein Psi02_55010 [Planotetraspora silvatica]|uniref:Uncharacterized protein n=1 Tax=Planotetraspora silvatica TaxID=234614 RepID=A0A8J3USN7_9ACTN|nr:hypothetical protein Psi02_55010 [Planotetraspora silvatica]